ncbi:hypothetical protein PENTCL1PPCAC_27600, partial [Pristionchus entomophagus]
LQTLVEDSHGSFHDAFLTPTKSSSSPISISMVDTLVEDPHGSFHDAFLTPTKSSSSPISIPMVDPSSSVFLSSPHSLCQSTLGDDSMGWSTPPRPSLGHWPSLKDAISTIPIGLHPEIAVLDPSPDRPENRAPRRRVAELAEIFDRGAPSPRPDASAVDGGAFLSLAPPYHLLPNTPYFRKAPIAPPPLKAPVPPAGAQRVINRYLNSMKVMDNLGEMEIQSLMCFNFNRTIGYCPYTIPEKPPLEVRVPADRDDIIEEDWSVWSGANHLKRTRL